MNIRILASSIICSFLLFVPAAVAGSFSDGALQAEASAGNDPVKATIEARSAAADFIAALPINAGNITFVSGAPDGFGMYDPREAIFKAGEPLVTYAEIGGLDWKKGERGVVSGFTADLQLLGADGTILAEQPNFGTFSFNAVAPLQEVMAVLTLTANGIGAGEYKVRYVLKDANSSDTTNIEQDFKIAE